MKNGIMQQRYGNECGREFDVSPFVDIIPNRF